MVTQSKQSAQKKATAPQTPRLKLRAMDADAWRIFTRKAGVLPDRRTRRARQRLKRELREERAADES